MLPLVIYHKNCMDGIGAAYAVWVHLGKPAYLEFLPASYNDPIPDVTGRKIFIVDFSYPRQQLEQLASHNELMVIDHHKTAQYDLKCLSYAHFDMTRSGAGLAWDILNPDIPRPEIINYIEDRDLWKWELPNSREINDALFSRDLKPTELGNVDVKTLLIEGQAICRLKKKQLDMALGTTHMITIGDFNVPAISTCVNMSETCEALLKAHPAAPFTVTYFITPEGTKYSLRSDGRCDVSAICKKYGGGGHANAAGYIR